jgi:lactaldehyde dehydrogenase/glycolaldehyde dehydrogenase
MTTKSLPRLIADVTGVYTAGEWRRGEGPPLPVMNPADGEVLIELDTAGEAQAHEALRVAKDAQPAWARRSLPDRAAYLRRIADEVEASAPELAELLALEVGKPLAQGEGELEWACATLRYQAGCAYHLTGEIVPSDDPNETIHFNRVPVGVVVAICAWNFPMAMFFRKSAPALLAGNAVVLKPSETTPLAALALARVIERVELPPGVLNVLAGGRELGAQLVADPLADMITMTGSVAAGRAIASEASNRVAKVSLELGGKAPAIVWRDADLDVAVPALLAARHVNSGQVCTCAERVYVHREIAEEFTRRYVEGVAALKVGDPFGDVDMGPLVSAAQRDKVLGMIDRAIADGARRIEPEVGEEPGPSGGYWVRPTVLAGVRPGTEIVEQEVFGPVTPIVEVEDLDEALALANDSDYGLSGYIYSGDYDVITRVTRELEVGEIYVNRTLGEAPQGFHTGHKQSGVGGEDGLNGLLRYTEIRTVYHNPQGTGTIVDDELGG